MGKINAKAIMYALLPLLVLQFSSFAGAVDILFYSDKSGCDGVAIGCLNVGTDQCCFVNEIQAGSVAVLSAGSNVFSAVYTDGGCTTFVGTNLGMGDICYGGVNVVGWYTGANYYNGRRRSLLADPTTCASQMEPNSVLFTEDSTKGHWILITANVDQVYSEMHTVPDAEKAGWLKSRGAIFDQL